MDSIAKQTIMLADKSGLRKRDSMLSPIRGVTPKSDDEVRGMMARFGIGVKKKKVESVDVDGLEKENVETENGAEVVNNK